MKISNRDRDCPPFTTADGSTIREFLHTQTTRALAEATSRRRGRTTQRHYHRRLRGALPHPRGRRGRTTEVDERDSSSVGPGDAILIPAGRVARAPRHRRGHAPLPVLLRAAVLARRHVLRLTGRLRRMTIAFARGVPAPECLPVQELADCARAAIERDGAPSCPTAPAAATGRCASGSRRGTASSRDACCSRAARSRASSSSRSSSSARHARARRGADVRPAAEDPRAARRRGRAVPMDDEGLDRRARASPRTATPRLPLHDPDLPEPERAHDSEAERRRRLAELAAEHELLVLEDDPYGLVRFEGDALPSAVRARRRRDGVLLVVVLEDRSRRVARRLLRPAGGSRRRPRGARDVDLHLAAVPLAGDRARVPPARELRAESRARATASSRERRDAMLAALERECPPTPRWSRPDGGYFVWLDLPSGADAGELLSGDRRRRHLRQGHRLLPRRRRRELRRGSPSASRRPTRSARGSRSSPSWSRPM